MKKAVLINRGTNEIIKIGEYPREDMGPVTGLDPSLEWLIYREEMPGYEPSSQGLKEVLPDIASCPLDDEYPYLRKYLVTYEVVPKSSPITDFPEFKKVIVAPIQLVRQYPEIKAWFDVNGLPIVKTNETTVHLFCNEIMPEDQELVDGLLQVGQITVIER